MKTLIVGDVHGCADELAELLELAAPDRVVLVGDLFTKGPSPCGVWELVLRWKAESVLGNHDDHILRRGGFRGLPSEALIWLADRPLLLHGEGWVVVHAGVEPHGGETDRKTALYLRRWPDDSQENNPFWWELYSGSDLVIYGHDARRGLQDHRPRSLGLDTGCVYGGSLTGFLLESGELLEVPARKTYVFADRPEFPRD
jgi:predicted phosphodiesterase